MKQGSNQAHAKAPEQDGEPLAADADPRVGRPSSEPFADGPAAKPRSPAQQWSQEEPHCPQPDEHDSTAEADGGGGDDHLPRGAEPSSLHKHEVKVAYGPDDLLRAMDSAPVTCPSSVRVTSLESLLWKAKT